MYPTTDNTSDLGSSVLRYRNQYISGSGMIDFLDNGKIRMGNSDDLQIYHDGSNSYIKEDGTGSLLLWSTGTEIKLLGGSGAETLADFNVDGAVELYYDNSKKFETQSGGAKVTGHLRFNDNGKLLLGASDDLQIFHNGSSNRIYTYNGSIDIRNAENG